VNDSVTRTSVSRPGPHICVSAILRVLCSTGPPRGADTHTHACVQVVVHALHILRCDPMGSSSLKQQNVTLLGIALHCTALRCTQGFPLSPLRPTVGRRWCTSLRISQSTHCGSVSEDDRFSEAAVSAVLQSDRCLQLATSLKTNWRPRWYPPRLV